ncbi:hypothetical protein CC77DRAFT_1025469 [Alternaria alternata]|uniref:Uncharacterized protein n=1 Tax=Alternaria alternata TaxID=5599 RepID=A0A177D5R1_ALTAL|nr:hypothetical protein CC77DRAFT_1025469 [Alternaria alternata]OAG14856.1 hypothetical protein CC77DRAFT_1025469 [Alternaria alternata]
MATPQQSITIVNGRRCTRSRARTALTTSKTTETSTATPPAVTTSTAAEETSQIQTTTAQTSSPPPPPPPPPSSTAPASTTTPADQPAQQPTAVPTTSTTEVAATSAIAVPTSLVVSSRVPARFTAPAISNGPTQDTSPQLPIETDTRAQPSIVTDSPAQARPQPTTSLVDSTPTGGSAGIIAPEGSTGGDDGPLTFANSGNIGGIIGGVFGGVAALALISILLFFCLRKRKSRPVRWNEKQETGPSFLARLKTIPSGVGAFVARIKGSEAGPMSNPYQRHAAQASVGSVYSRDSNGRGRSSSEPQGFFGVKRAGSNNSRSSKKSERNLLRKKPSSISSNYRFPGIIEDTGSPNPFADPGPQSKLLVLNPDPRSAPVTPQVPAATADAAPRDPFASVMDPPGAAPAWAQPPTHHHQRTMSSISALSSHPVSSFYTADNPFRDPPYAPPVPTQAVLPSHTRRSSMALPGFNALSTVDATSTFASRDSDIFFGEPGPSRPSTNFFTPAPTGRTVRQSDPFDLDRPEVLGFNSIFNRKDVNGNITRQPTRSKRTSSVGNWGNTATDVNNYGLFPRDSTKQPPWGPNGRR